MFSSPRTRLLVLMSVCLAVVVGHVAGAALRAEEKPAQGNDPKDRTDLLGDPLPAGAVCRLGTNRLCHGTEIAAAVFAPDGKTLYSADRAGNVGVWEVATGQALVTFRCRVMASPRSLAFSPDGKTLATCDDDGRTTLWKTTTGRSLGNLADHKSRRDQLLFSPDGKTLASVSYGTDGDMNELQLASLPSGQSLWKISSSGNRVRGLAFSPDGKILAASQYDRSLRLYDTTNGKELRKIDAPKGYGGPVVFSSDGKVLISSGYDKILRIHETATGREILSWQAHDDVIRFLAISSDGKRIASGSDDGVITVWKTETGLVDGKIDCPQKSVTLPCKWSTSFLGFSPDGNILLSAHYSRLRLWDLEKGSERLQFPGHAMAISRLVYTRDGRHIITGGHDGWLRLWDAASGRELRALHADDFPLVFLSLSPNGRRVLFGRSKVGEWDLVEGSVRILWNNVADNCYRCQEIGNSHWRSDAAVSPDGKWMTLGYQNEQAFWTAYGGKPLKPLDFRNSDHTALVRPEENTVLIRIDRSRHGMISVRQPPDGKSILEIGLKDARFHSLAFSPDGRTLLAGCGDGRIRFYDPTTGRERAALHAHPYGSEIAVSSDGRLFASVGDAYMDVDDRGIRIWEWASQREVLRFNPGAAERPRGLDFAPDGKTLASWGESTNSGASVTALLWNVMPSDPLPAEPAAARHQLETLWEQLASDDAVVGYRSACTLAAAPDLALELLGRRLTPAVDFQVRIDRAVRELDDDQFKTREAATALLRNTPAAIPALERVLAEKPPLEVRVRAEKILAHLRIDPRPSGPLLRSLRALGVLERIGSAEAQRILTRMAEGDPYADETQDAKASLARLAARPPKVNQAQEKRVLAEIHKLKGRVVLDELNPDKPVVTVDLRNTPVADADLTCLKGLSRLQELYLNDTRITDAGLIHLKELSHLLDLDLTGTKVTRAGIDDLQKVLPKVIVVHKSEQEGSRVKD